MRAVVLRAGQFTTAGLLLLFASAVGALLGYAAWFSAASKVDADTLGMLATMVSAFSLVALFAAAGVAPNVAVSVAASAVERRGQLVSMSLMSAVTVAAVLAGVFTMVAPFIESLSVVSSSPLTAGAFIVAAVASAAAAVLDAVVNAVRHPGAVLVRTFTQGGVRLGLVVAVLFAAGMVFGPTGGIVIWAVAAIAGVVPPVVMLYRWGLFPKRFDRHDIAQLRSGLHWQQLATVSGQIPPFALPILITATIGPAATTSFFLAWQLASGCFMVQGAITPTVLVRTAGDVSNRRRVLATASKLLIVLLLPICAVVLVVGPFVLSTFGVRQQSSMLVLILLVVSALPDSFTGVCVASWRSSGLERRAALFNVMLSAAVLFAAWLFVPMFGVVAAAAVFLVAQTAGAFWCLQVERHEQLS